MTPAKPTFEEFYYKYSIYDEYIKPDIEFLSKVPTIQKLWENTYNYIEGCASNWLAIMKIRIKYIGILIIMM